MSGEQPPEAHDPDLITLSQAAAFLRVRPTELMGAIRNGEVPIYQRRGRIWFSRSELVERMPVVLLFHVRTGDRRDARRVARARAGR